MTARRRGRDDESPTSRPATDPPSFAEALGDVEPLGDRATRVPPRPIRPHTARPERPPIWTFPVPDEPLLGFASGIQSRQLRRLRAGRIRPEAEIDLHGLTAGAARQHLRRELAAAAAAGRRCVVVVHGKGLRSPADPVLRSSLPGWLTGARAGARVLAFAPARPADGGSGATYVLLHRS